MGLLTFQNNRASEVKLEGVRGWEKRERADMGRMEKRHVAE